MFEPNWDEVGELQATIDLFCSWLDNQGIRGMNYKVHRIEDRTPVLIVTVEGTGSGEVLFYSHLDKQPSRPNLWSEAYTHSRLLDGIHSYLEEGLLTMATVATCATAIRLLQEAGIPHPKATFLIETCEESGSFDLPPYLDALTDELGNPDLIVVLDSGGPSYDHIWITEALRGLVAETEC